MQRICARIGYSFTLNYLKQNNDSDFLLSEIPQISDSDKTFLDGPVLPDELLKTWHDGHGASSRDRVFETLL